MSLESRSVIVVGGPDAGKSAFIGRLRLALRSKGGLLASPRDPRNVTYVNKIVAYLNRGEYAPRTDPDDEVRDFSTPLVVQHGPNAGLEADLCIPDLSGEVWRNATETRTLPKVWMHKMAESVGAIVFLRALSPANVPALDWVTASRLMSITRHRKMAEKYAKMVPAQVQLCDWLNLLESQLGIATDVSRPRVALVVSAWDMLGTNPLQETPEEFIRRNYPMLHGRIQDRGRIDIRLFGCSATGGDLKYNDVYREEYKTSNPADKGWVILSHSGRTRSDDDFTLPVAWTLGDEIDVVEATTAA